MRTLRERLTARDTPPTVVIDHVERPARPLTVRNAATPTPAPEPTPEPTFAVGALVRITRTHGVIDRRGMTGEVIRLLPHLSAVVRLSATHEQAVVPLADLVPVVRQPASARRADERAA